MTDAEFALHSARVMAAVDPFMPSVIRLYMPENARGLDPTLIGSGCLLWHRGKRYLITAAHVAAKRPDHAKYIAVADELVVADGFRFNKLPGSQEIPDPLDISVARLDDDTGERLVGGGLRFLTANQFADDSFPASHPAAPRGEWYAAIGYPANMAKRISATRTRSDWIVYDSGVATEAQYAALGLSHATNIVMQFDRDRVHTANGVHRSKSFDGISGGGIFRMPSVEQPGDLRPPRLVGIVIEEDEENRALIGVRLERILGAIDRTPALRLNQGQEDG